MDNAPARELAAYQIDPVRGFLPADEPIEQLPPTFEQWERIAANVPALLMADQLRSTLDQLLPLPVNRLENEPQLQRAMVLLSVFGNAYVWAGEQPAVSIPRG